ncbi:MAG: hypothetical protein AB1716_05945 [Planctomycetota bacterium]
MGALGTTALMGLAVLLLAGGALFFRGLRGRRVGQEPHCRKCGYNLTGLTGDTCPECGGTASGRNLVIGVRRRRPRLWVPGLVLLGVSVTGLSSIAYIYAKGVNWYIYLPTFVLAEQARSDDVRAIDELVRRFRLGSLGERPLIKLVPLALTRQGLRPMVYSFSSWTAFLAALEAAGHLTGDQQERFHDQIVTIDLECRPTIRAGEDVLLRLTYLTGGAPGASGAWTLESPRLKVGNHVVSDGWLMCDGILSQNEGGSHGHTFPAEDLEPGEYKAEFRAVKVFSNPSFRRPVLLTREFEVLPADAADTVRLVPKPALARELRKGIVISTTTQPWGGPGSSASTYIEIAVNVQVPIDCAFKVLGRAAGRELELGSVELRKGQSLGFRCQQSCRADLSGIEWLVPILRASTDVAKDTPDILEIWDGEVEFAPIKVNHPTSAPASQGGAR